MKLSYISGAIALMAVGAAGMWGVNEYLSLKAQLKEIQPNSKIVVQAPSPQPEVSASPTSQTTPQSSPSPSVLANSNNLSLCDQLDSVAKAGKSVSEFIVNSGQYDKFAAEVTTKCNWNVEQLQAANRILHPPAQVSFDNLPLCDQLDSVAKAGKSVSDFIINSGRYDEFATEVTTKCNWNTGQLQIADRILHPPVQTASRDYNLGDQEYNSNWQPTEEHESSVANSSVSAPRHTPWNNCNGVLEPGESYSAECDARQRQSDQTGIIVPGDNRNSLTRGDYPHQGGGYY